MLPVFVIAVAFSVCDCAPLTAKNVSLDPQQNDRALYIKIYSSFEISQSDITLLQTQLDTVGFEKFTSIEDTYMYNGYCCKR